MGIRQWFVNWICGSDAYDRPLREFFYLDETSVISLLASLEGEITDRLIVRESSESKSRKKSGGGINVEALRLSHNRESEEIERSGTETVQRSVIQSRFDELYDARKDELLIAENSDESSRLSKDHINRGDLLEIELDLTVHKSYELYKILEYITEVSEDVGDTEEFELESEYELEEMINFLDSLFGNRIPVEGEATNYVIDDEEIVPVDAVDDDAEPLRIVGKLDRNSLWDDPLSTLSEGESFTLFARVTTDGFNEEWHPTRLTEVLRDSFPQQAQKLNTLLEDALLEVSSDRKEINVERSWSQILMLYVEGLREADAELSDEHVQECKDATMDGTELSSTPENLATAIETLVDFTNCIESDSELQIDTDQLSEIRRQAILSDMTEVDASNSQSIAVSPIGIYW